MAQWAERSLPKCEDLSLDPRTHIKAGLSTSAGNASTPMRRGKWRQETFWKLMGQVACHTQQKNEEETVSKQVDVEDQHPKLAPDLHMCML